MNLISRVKPLIQTKTIGGRIWFGESDIDSILSYVWKRDQSERMLTGSFLVIISNLFNMHNLENSYRFPRTNFRRGICQAAKRYCLDHHLNLGIRWRGNAHLLSVVDLPDEGLPTRPMRGSRGILENSIQSCDEWTGRVADVGTLGAKRVALLEGNFVQMMSIDKPAPGATFLIRKVSKPVETPYKTDPQDRLPYQKAL